jgi:flap endonuclease-1
VGVGLQPITVKDTIDLESLRDRRLAVDGNGELYQFLALIRMPDGTPLRDHTGRPTSHLSGLFYRTTRLITDYGPQLVFVFDGTPPTLKSDELSRRRAIRQRYDEELAAARAAGDLARAYSKATMTSRLTREMVGEAMHLLRLMGIPAVQAPSEAEAQAAHMARRGSVWAAASKDFDSLLFGATRLVRFLTISGKEFLPSKGVFRPITPELIELDRMLAALEITREQLVDVAILVGTDFNSGIKGIGPKKALSLVRRHGAIEGMPAPVRDVVEPMASAVRAIFLHPDVTDDYRIEARPCDVSGVVQYLCGERAFSEKRVTAALQRAFPEAVSNSGLQLPRQEPEV